MNERGGLWLLVAQLGCATGSPATGAAAEGEKASAVAGPNEGDPAPAEPEHGQDDRAEASVSVVLRGAPRQASVTVRASDDRAPVFGPAPLEGDLRLPPGFWTVEVVADDKPRVLEVYTQPGARVVLDWESLETPQLEGATHVDRHRAEIWWAADMQRLIEAGASDWDGKSDMPAELRAALERSAAEIEAAGDSPYADLLRLRHGSYLAQIVGPQAGWELVSTVPPDAVAWAAYAPHLLELSYLLAAVPEADAHLAEVRERVVDPGLRSAFHAVDLFRAEAKGDDDALAAAVLEATDVRGPLVAGQSMPSFVLRTLDNRELRSSEMRGPYLLEVWSTWCAPCIEQMAELHDLHAEASQGGRLQLVSVNINDTREPVNAFRKERWPMPWPNAWVPGGDALFEGWGLGKTRVPFAVLVDADGVVREMGPHVSLERAQALAQ